MSRVKRITRRNNQPPAPSVREKISKVLWEQWDPIGVNDEPNARDEYDGYIRSIYTLLVQGASDAEIAALLRQHEIVNMGLRGSSQEHLQSVVEALRTVIEE